MFCLHSALHRQVIAAVFVSVSFMFEPARSFCFACEEAPLLRVGLLQLCEAACFHGYVIDQPAGFVNVHCLSFAQRPEAALRSSAPRGGFLSPGGQRPRYMAVCLTFIIYYIRLILVDALLTLLLILLCLIDIVIDTIELLCLLFCSELLG